MPSYMYRPPESERLLLEACVRVSLFGGKKPLSDRDRKMIADRQAMVAAIGYLRHHLPAATIEDANDERRNQPGFDIVVDGKYRVQVKGNTNFQTVQFSHKSLDGADLDYDLMLVVDIGVTLDGNDAIKPLAAVPVKSCADIYVVPNNVVRGWLAEGRCVNKRGNWIHFYKTPSRASGQIRELLEYLDRPDLIKPS